MLIWPQATTSATTTTRASNLQIPLSIPSVHVPVVRISGEARLILTLANIPHVRGMPRVDDRLFLYLHGLSLSLPTYKYVSHLT